MAEKLKWTKTSVKHCFEACVTCNNIGLLLKVLVTNFITNVDQILSNILGYFYFV